MKSRQGSFLRIAAMAVLLLAGTSLHAAPPEHAQPAGARLDFVASPYADFLSYLLHRDSPDFPDLRASVPLDNVKELNTGSFLPAYAMASDVRNYADLYKLAYTYDESDVLITTLKQGEPQFQRFMTYWQQHIEPTEQSTIQAWKTEEVKGHHVERLEELTRMRLPYASVMVAVIALGPPDRSIENPPIMFASMKDASLPAVVGYEGTHMLMSGRAGDWKKRQNATKAIELISAHGGTSYDIEEALCLLMQSKLPEAYGAKVTARDTGDTPRRVLLRAMERDWGRYRADTAMNAADFAIDETIRTFGAGSVADTSP